MHGNISRRRMTPYELVMTRTVERDGCLIFVGATIKGYGCVSDKHRTVLAHRVVAEHHYGNIDGLVVLHRCDTPRCVRPDHLVVGTVKDNAADMVAKGRSVRGARHHKARLDDDLVRAIRADVRPAGQVASQYGVSRSTVNDVRSLRTWRHVT